MTPSFDLIHTLTGGRLGIYDVACPECGPSRKSPVNQKRNVLRIWRQEPDFATFRCARCDLAGHARADGAAAVSLVSLPLGGEGKVADCAERTARSLAIWNEAGAFQASPAETYLASRGLAYDGAALRWHPRCPFGKDRVGCMIGLVRNIVTNAPQAIHRTAIDGAGRKLSHLGANGRLSYGPTAGGAIKLTDDADVTLALANGEGIESTLSIRCLPDMERMPVWSLLNKGGIAAFPVLGGIESLWIIADHDPAGIVAARECAARWEAADCEVLLIAPTKPGADLNDLARVAMTPAVPQKEYANA